MPEASSDGKSKEQLELERLVDAVAKKNAGLSDARRAERYPFNIPITLSAMSASETLTQIASAWAMDISYDGLGLLTEYKCFPKEIVYANLGVVIGRPFHIRMEMLYCKKILSKTYKCGGTFRF